MNKATPSDSRYIPLTQQPACCVPTCIQMVMLRNNIPLQPAEEIGYHLGLTVHPERKYLFYNVRVSETRPPAGYGTQIYKPEYSPNTAFEKLSIPLSLIVNSIEKFKTPQDLLSFLSNEEQTDEDTLVCFNHGVLIDDPTKMYGHVCVFDRVIGKTIRIIDPSPDSPKWRLVSVEKLYEAMVTHGEKRSAGCWVIKKLE